MNAVRELKKWDIFISYRRSKKTEKIAFWLQSELEKKTVESRTGQVFVLDVFLDITEPHRADFQRNLVPILENSRAMIVIADEGATLRRKKECDYLYEELEWWALNRPKTPFIVVQLDPRSGRLLLDDPVFSNIKWTSVNCQNCFWDAWDGDAFKEAAKEKLIENLRISIRDFGFRVHHEEVRRLRVRACAAMIFAALALVAAGFAWRQRETAEWRRKIAESRRLAALSVNELNEGRPDVACDLSISAMNILETDEAIKALSEAVNYDARLEHVLRGHLGRVTSIVFSSSGLRMASADEYGQIMLREMPRGRLMAKMRLGCSVAGEVGVAFDSSGKQLVAADVDGRVAVWTLPSETPHRASPLRQGYQPEWLEHAGNPGEIRNGLSLFFDWPELKIARLPPNGLVIFNLETRRKDAVTLELPPSAHIYRRNVLSARLHFDRSGDNLAGVLSAHTDAPIPVGVVTIWDPGDGRVKWAQSTRSLEPSALAMDPDLEWLAADSMGASKFGGTSIFDPLTSNSADETRLSLSGLDYVSVLASSPKKGQMLSAHSDKKIRIWDIKKGEEVLGTPINAHFGVSALAVVPDNSWLVSGGQDGKIYLWNLRSEERRIQGLPAIRRRAAQIARSGLTLSERRRFYPAE